MMSLFSSFDFMLFYSSYFIIFILFFFVFTPIYKLNYFSFVSGVFCQDTMIKFFYSLKPKNFNKSVSLILISILIFIFLANFFSVFSYNFPLTAQFGSVLTLSLTFWVSFMLFSFFSNLKGSLLHFIPEGAPILLTFFLFLIELISSVIRPVTLTVRLVANILAGHLLMILLSKLVFLCSPMFLIYIFLNLVELVVGLIQAYIFSTMITLYFAEVH